MALSIGDEVFVTRINTAIGSVKFEGKERVKISSIINVGTPFTAFIFTPDINGSVYFSSRFGDTYEEIKGCDVEYRDFLNCTFTTSLCSALSADISTESMLNWYHNHSEIGRINRTNKINKNMETTKSIVEFAKNLTLSKEEKLLRKAGLKDSEGNWTSEARAIVISKRAKEFGYKNWGEMITSVGQNHVSAIEYAHLFDKYKEELIKIATEFEKENKKK